MPRSRSLLVRFACALALALPATAIGAIGANKGFVPDAVSIGQTATLTVYFLNANPDPATGLAFTDNLPGSVRIASPANVSNNCAGSVTATPGTAVLSLSGGTIPAASGNTPGACQVSVSVVSNVAGTYINTIPANGVSSTEGGNPQQAQATLTVSSLSPITGSKTFVPTNVHGNGPASRVTITLNNPNGIALTGVAFTDPLPTSVVVATPANASTTCGAGTVTATPGASSASLGGGTIAAAGSCTMAFDVIASPATAAVDATRTNTIAAGAVTSAQGATNASFSATIRVQTGAQVAKAFAPSTITSGGVSTLTVTLRNFNNSVTGPLDFTDALPLVSGNQMTIASPVVASTTCPGSPTINAVAGASSWGITGGSLPAAPAGIGSSSCTVSVQVTAANGGTAPITLGNTLGPGNFGGMSYAAATGNLVVNPVSVISAVKAFAPATIAQTMTSTLTITLRNNSAGAATITSFTDNLTTLGTGFAVAPAPAASTTCGGTLTATPGTTAITLAGGTIPAGAPGSCTITVPVRAAANASVGTRTNTISPGQIQTSLGNNVVPVTANLAVNRALLPTKSFAPAVVVAGAVARLTITVAHANGVEAFTNLAFTDTLPGAGATQHVVATPPNVTNSCGGAVTAPAGSTTVVLAGGTLATGATSCQVAVDVRTPSGTAGTVTNTIPAGGVTATTTPGGVAVASVDAASANIQRILSFVTASKSFTPPTVPVGGTSTMVLTILNNNANAVNLTAVSLSDNLPAGMVVANPPLASFTGTGCAGTVTAIAGAGTVALSGGTINANRVCTLQVNVTANAAGNLINVIPANSLVAAQGISNNSAIAATLASIGLADVAVTKTDGVTTAVPGASVTYTITVSNAGPNDVAGATFTDTPPAGVTFTSWSCAPGAGAACTASGSGPINDAVTIPSGQSVVYAVTAAIASSLTGTIANTATIDPPGTLVDPNTTNNSATDTDTLTPQADLAISKTDGVATAVPGSTLTYTIVASNAGPSAAPGATVADTFPATLTGVTWTCVGAGGGTCTAAGAGNIADTVNLPAGASVTYTVNATVAANATGTLANTATVVPPGSVSDPNPGNNTATDTDTLTPSADLAITKTDGVASVTPGGGVTYTIVASNLGPSDAPGATVTDTFPATLTGVAWTCLGAGGGTCPASGTGNLNATVGLPVGASVTFTVSATVSPSATGSLVNTATVAPPGGVTDPNPANNAATDVDTLTPTADLAITKTDGVASVTPGGSITYTIVASNAGPSAAPGATVTDTFPATLTGVTWTCVGAGGGSCPANGVGNLNATVGLPVGASVTFTVSATVAPSATGSLVNTATVAPPGGLTDPNPANNSATDTDTLTRQVTLAVAKTDGSATYTPGGTATYAVTVTNTGLSDALDVTVTDALPAGVTLTANATCVANGTSSCGTVSGSTGQAAFGAIGAQVGAGGANTLVFTIPVAFASGMSANPLVNTATATDGSSGASASGSDSNTLSVNVSLAVTKTDGSATYTPGGTATYTVTVADTGVTDALNVTVTDSLPPGATLTGTVTCVANGTSSCGTVTGAAGQTSFGATLARVNAGAGNTIVFTVPVAFAPAMTTDPLVNTASAIDLPSGATANGSDSDALATNVSLAVTKTDGSATYTPGGTATYTVTVADTGVTDALNVTVTDSLPPGVTLTGTVTCVANGTSSCGTVTGAAGQTSFGATLARVNAGTGNTIVFTVPVAFAPGMTADPLINTATATDLPSGITANGSDSDTLAPGVVLAVQKSDGSATYSPGGTATYTVTVANAGLSDALSVTLSDPLPAGVTLTGAVACVANGTSSCGTVSGTTGQAAFGATGARVGAGGANTLVFTVPVAFASGMSTNPLVNTATATDVASGASASGSDSNTLSANVSLAVAKTDGSATYSPGGTATYTVTVTNTGLTDALNVTVADPLPASVTLTGSVTCTAGGTSSCGTVTGVAGGVSFGATAARINVGAGNALVFTVPVAFAPGMTTNPLVNTASAIDLPSGATANGSDSNVRAASVDVTVVKVGPAQVNIGGTVAYLVTIGNNGPASANWTSFVDTVPAAIVGIGASCGSPTGGAACGPVNVAGNAVTGSVALLPVGGSVTITITGTMTGTAPVVNTVSVTPPPGVTETNLANNLSTVTTAVGTLLAPPLGSKSVREVSPGVLEWRVVWINAINTVQLVVRMLDPLPAGTSYVAGSLSCAPQGSTTVSGCVFDSTGARVVVDATLGADSGRTTEAAALNELVVTFRTQLAPTTGSVVNVANLGWDANGNGSITDDVASGQIAITASAAIASSSVAIPATSREALVALMLLLLAGAARQLRARRRRNGTSR